MPAATVSGSFTWWRGLLASLRLDRTTRRAGLVGVSALLLVLAFPPFVLGWVGFVALVPLHFAVRGATARDAALSGAAFALATSFLLFGWALGLPGFGLHHALGFALYLAIYPAVLCAAWSRVSDHPGAASIVPAILVVLDWTRGHAGFLAFPMGTLGQTQHANITLVQLASIGGEPLVTFVVAAANIAIAQLWSTVRTAERVPLSNRRGPVLVLAAVITCHLVGGKLRQEDAGRSIVVAAVQPDFDPAARSADEVVVLDQLTRQAASAGAELVVWPESAAGDVETDFLARLRARAVVDGAAVPVLVGSSGPGSSGSDEASSRGTNALFLVKPGEPLGEPYRKVHLVPFFETMPAPLTSFVQARPRFDTAPGEKRITMPFGELHVEPLICFESLFADDVRATASSSPGVIALAVNDGWFGKTAAARMHNIASVFRAVENRRPVVIASNRGPSEIIDSNGRVVARAVAFTPGMITALVRTDAPAGLYRAHGDLVWAAVIALLVLTSVVRSRGAASTARGSTGAA